MGAQDNRKSLQLWRTEVLTYKDIDPAFCEKECCAGRIKGKCLAVSGVCGHPEPRRNRS